MKTKFIGLILALAFPFLTSCHKEDLDVPNTWTNWNEVDLNKIDSYYGREFEAVKVLGDYYPDLMSPSQYISYVFNTDQTVTVTHDLISRNYPFTFSNGTFKYERSSILGVNDTIMLTFSHLDEYYLKMDYQETSGYTGSVFKNSYRMFPTLLK